MKKHLFNDEDIKLIKKMYIEELLSTRIISSKFNVDRGVITRLLRKNGITIKKTGRIDLGGKKISDKKWRDNNKNHTSKVYKNWSKDNRDHLRSYHEIWRKDNEKHKETCRNYENNRRRTDPIHRLNCNIRTAVYFILKENNMKKYKRTFETLGYTSQELYDHLNGLLNDGMTWENYGQWHVDHRLPITSFNFKSVEDDEFKKCWSLSNLQPMWGDENIRKYNHIIY